VTSKWSALQADSKTGESQALGEVQGLDRRDRAFMCGPVGAPDAIHGPKVGFLRADAQQLPLRDETVDAVTSVAMLQLIPNPGVALAEMARVLRPGGRIAVMVPTAGAAGPLWGILPDGGARFFGEDELGDIFEDLGLVGVRTRSLANFQWVRAKKP
jgi:arsenite methyltransferase